MVEERVVEVEVALAPGAAVAAHAGGEGLGEEEGEACREISAEQVQSIGRHRRRTIQPAEAAGSEEPLAASVAAGGFAVVAADFEVVEACPLGREALQWEAMPCTCTDRNPHHHRPESELEVERAGEEVQHEERPWKAGLAAAEVEAEEQHGVLLEVEAGCLEV